MRVVSPYSTAKRIDAPVDISASRGDVYWKAYI